MNCFIEQEKRAQIEGILLNLPISVLGFQAFDYMRSSIYLFLLISDEKYRIKSSCLFCVVEIPFCVSPFHSSVKPVYIVLPFFNPLLLLSFTPIHHKWLFFSWLPALYISNNVVVSFPGNSFNERCPVVKHR